MGRVTLENVVKEYDDVVAVNEMTLDIEDGEFVTLVGPSGCGKSTTLETIAGLTKPTRGTIEIADREVTNLPPKDRGIAMVFQNIALFPHMDVYDNISFGLRLRNFDTDEIDRRVEHAADVVQLQGMLERMPDELSGGQRQRVAIARAIVREPEAFLMDEPLANLDAKLRVHMRTELQRLHKELDTTTIYVTHDQAEAMTMSDRIAVINDGDLQQIAPPLTCYNEPANEFVAGFIGSPSMNFLEGELLDGGVRTAYGTVEFDTDDVGVSPGDAVRLTAAGLETNHGTLPLDVKTLDLADDEEIPATVTEDGTLDVEAADLEPTPTAIASDGSFDLDVSDFVVEPGDEVTMGVRPENIHVAGADHGIADVTRSFDVTTDVLEPMGDQIFVYLMFEETSGGMSDDADQLLMSVDPESQVEEDEHLDIVLDRTNVHLFDDDSGIALAHGLAGGEH